VLGSIVMSPDDSKALLFSTSSGRARYAAWDRGIDDPALAVEVFASVKPVAGVSISPDGGTAVLRHERSENGDVASDSVFYNEWALTLVELGGFFANPIRLPAEPVEQAVTGDGRFGFVILDGQSWLLQLDFASLIHENISLKSPAEHLGVMPGSDLVWVSQTHDLGRISFFDVDTAELQTVTGFELNSGIED